MEKRACLLLHGFSGGPFEIQPLAEYLERSGTVCRVPTLPGHGANSHLLGNVSWRDWIKACEQEADQMVRHYGSFDLAGFSMGGLLAAYLANRYPVRKLVLLNTALIYVSPWRFMTELAGQMKKRDWRHVRKMRSTPVRATWQFMSLVRELKPEIPRVKAPTLIIQGERDPVVHPFSACYLERKLSCEREVCWFPKSRHLICLDVEANEVFRSVERFLS